jgi:TonB family protein
MKLRSLPVWVPCGVLPVVVFVLAIAAGMAEMGCGSDQAARTAANARSHKKHGAGDGSGDFDASPAAAAMGLENEIGVYDSGDIDQALAEHMDEVRDCYRRAGRAQRYAGGVVNLRFLVDGGGTPKDVLVVGTALGNYDVERCVVAVGRAMRFPPPNGNKATSFEYPVEFRSTHEIQVQDLNDSLKVERDVAAALHSLSPCGAVSRTGAAAVFYVDSNGGVGSVGISAESALNEPAAACAVREIRHWRMSATLPGRMLRCRATLPGGVASADARRASTGPLTVASRRRHR